VDWAIEERGYSQRRACGLVGIAPRVYRYRSSRPDDAGLRKRLHELAAQRRRRRQVGGVRVVKELKGLAQRGFELASLRRLRVRANSRRSISLVTAICSVLSTSTVMAAW